MRLPRDLSGAELVKLLRIFGYEPTRQSGSYIRLTSMLHGQHHITIPAHDPLRPGTLNAILTQVASHQSLSREALLQTLFA